MTTPAQERRGMFSGLSRWWAKRQGRKLVKQAAHMAVANAKHWQPDVLRAIDASGISPMELMRMQHHMIESQYSPNPDAADRHWSMAAQQIGLSRAEARIDEPDAPTPQRNLFQRMGASIRSAATAPARGWSRWRSKVHGQKTVKTAAQLMAANLSHYHPDTLRSIYQAKRAGRLTPLDLMYQQKQFVEDAFRRDSRFAPQPAAQQANPFAQQQTDQFSMQQARETYAQQQTDPFAQQGQPVGQQGQYGQLPDPYAQPGQPVGQQGQYGQPVDPYAQQTTQQFAPQSQFADPAADRFNAPYSPAANVPENQWVDQNAGQFPIPGEVGGTGADPNTIDYSGQVDPDTIDYYAQPDPAQQQPGQPVQQPGLQPEPGPGWSVQGDLYDNRVSNSNAQQVEQTGPAQLDPYAPQFEQPEPAVDPYAPRFEQTGQPVQPVQQATQSLPQPVMAGQAAPPPGANQQQAAEFGGSPIYDRLVAEMNARLEAAGNGPQQAGAPGETLDVQRWIGEGGTVAAPAQTAGQPGQPGQPGEVRDFRARSTSTPGPGRDPNNGNQR